MTSSPPAVPPDLTTPDEVPAAAPSAGDRPGATGAAADRAFDELCRRDHAAVAALAYVLTGDWGVAEDLAQDAFLEAFRRWDVIGAYDRPGAWVRRVVANRSVSHRRRRGSERRALARLTGRPAVVVGPPAHRRRATVGGAAHAARPPGPGVRPHLHRGPLDRPGRQGPGHRARHDQGPSPPGTHHVGRLARRPGPRGGRRPWPMTASPRPVAPCWPGPPTWSR